MVKKTYRIRPNFLGSEVGLVLKSMTIKSDYDTTANIYEENGRKIVKAGSIFISGEENVYSGILYEDIDITDGDKVAPIMVRGSYLKGKLPVAPTESQKTAFDAQGLYEIAETTITRPY